MDSKHGLIFRYLNVLRDWQGQLAMCFCFLLCSSR